jgi:pimeloyl-ACP methyl ester carboxylesterase
VAHLLTPSGITLYYEDNGPRHGPVLIFIMGLGAQLTVWPLPLVESLNHEGFRVIRLDNRDTGLSSKLDEHGKPSLLALLLRKKLRLPLKPPYHLNDMAQDVIDLMDGLQIPKAHIVGASMGGMIAQIIALQHKKRVLSLTSIMSSAGITRPALRDFRILWHLSKTRPPAHKLDAAIRYTIKLNQLIGSPDYPLDAQQLNDTVRHNLNRAYYPQGIARQLAAITASEGREDLLHKIRVPSLIIHGSADPLIPLNAGIHTARYIHKAKLEVLPGMGHNLPPQLIPQLVKLITKHVKKAEEKHIRKVAKKYLAKLARQLKAEAF